MGISAGRAVATFCLWLPRVLPRLPVSNHRARHRSSVTEPPKWASSCVRVGRGLTSTWSGFTITRPNDDDNRKARDATQEMQNPDLMIDARRADWVESEN